VIYATVSGRLTKDAQIRQAGGQPVCGFSIASSRKIKGEEKTMYVDCNVWGKRGEALCQYLTKGTSVVAVGELSTREHNGKTYLDLRVAEVDLLGGGRRDGASKSAGAAGQEKPADDYDTGDIPF
jgi:single-strand DNA-binding protein